MALRAPLITALHQAPIASPLAAPRPRDDYQSTPTLAAPTRATAAARCTRSPSECLLCSAVNSHLIHTSESLICSAHSMAVLSSGRV